MVLCRLMRIYTVSVFRPFLSVFFTFLLLLEKVCTFSSAFLYVHIHNNRTVTFWTKVFRKEFFCKGLSLYFEISLLSLMHQIFEQNFYPYVTVYLVRIWTYKNTDEKAHTFSRRSKNVKKRTKNGDCVNSPLGNKRLRYYGRKRQKNSLQPKVGWWG